MRAWGATAAISVLCLVGTAAAQPRMTAPAEVIAGANFEVSWSGSSHKLSYITIVPSGSADGTHGNYVYTKKGPKLKLRAPDTPGAHELRFIDGGTKKVLARDPISIAAATATLDAPARVRAGAGFEVSWAGPDNPTDFLTIVPAGAPERKYGDTAYTKKGRRLALRAPDEPGAYEVRYLTGQSRHTLAAAPIEVTGTSASVTAPAQVVAGADFEVRWSGPANELDFVSIVPAGAPKGASGDYAYTKRGSVLTLTAPDTAGAYEIRYVTGQSKSTLARAAIEVRPAQAGLEAPAEVVAGEVFEVRWTGPGNHLDYVAVTRSGAAAREQISYAYTRRGNPVRLEAPREPGTYELRYLTGQTSVTLASRPIAVAQRPTPGILRVISGGREGKSVDLSGGAAVELILDASGSMLQRHEGSRRIDIAKDAVIGLARDTLPAGTPFALRVFGHREADSCRTDLEIPMQKLVPRPVIDKVRSIEAKNLAKTPIAKSLELVAADLKDAKGERIVILVTDGEETCGGDPKRAIQNLVGQGVDVRVNIIGFAIDEEMLKETFRDWAQAGNGRYFDARHAGDVGRGVVEALRQPFQVLDEQGNVVATGVVNGDAVEVPAGTYTVEIPARAEKSRAGVQVAAGEETQVQLD